VCTLNHCCHGKPGSITLWACICSLTSIHYTLYTNIAQEILFLRSQFLCLFSLDLRISHVIVSHISGASPPLWTTHYILSICIHISQQKPHDISLIKRWRILWKTLKPFKFRLISHKNNGTLCEFIHLLCTSSYPSPPINHKNASLCLDCMCVLIFNTMIHCNITFIYTYYGLYTEYIKSAWINFQNSFNYHLK
jgi:hypothetical protein